ncbi:MAG TPA: OsmC family protein [Steroidobacteraceae bacterium]|nr:OsmC family protein [Steroidobacteraceae bacterium]
MSNPPAETIAHAPIDVQWVGRLNFEAGRPDGPKVRIDGDGQAAPSPFDVLLAAIATCASVDVVTILEKQRTPPQALSVRVEAKRAQSTPRRLASAILHFSISAPGTTIEKATRAVELSVTKYCSVRSSLIADAAVTWRVELEA